MDATSSRWRTSSVANVLLPFARQFQKNLAAIGAGGRFRNQATLLEFAQDAAEIAGIEPKFLAEFSGGRLRPVRDLVKHAGFGQRKRALRSPSRNTPICRV